MDILSKFAETLGDLIHEKYKTNKAFADAVGLPAPTVTRYRKAAHMPTVKNLVLIADHFQCSVDFLLGREIETPNLRFRPCPLFSEQIVFLALHFEKSFYGFYHAVGLPESTFFEWKNGSSVPTLESIVKIADHYDCRVDYVLGRES